jgi:cbb3-type cytochrome oxidase subunit 3
MAKLQQIILGRPSHWMLLLGLFGALYLMGDVSLHMRRFALFAIVLMALVTVALAFIVWEYRPHDSVTREAFDDAALPHQTREPDEV